MSTGDLHEISVRIGALQAEVDHARRSREVTHQKLEGITRQLEELALLARDVAAMKPEVQHYADARRRVAGAMLVLTVLSGGVGAFFSELVKMISHR